MSDGATPAGVARATPAATVVPIRDGPEGIEILLLRRSPVGAFGGMWVFPGGQVEPVDIAAVGAGSAADIAAGGRELEVACARVAAVREAAEEAALRLDADSLEVLSFWLPPPQAPRRFATWFFVAPVPAGADVVVDRGEIHEHRWMTPQAARAEQRAGTMDFAPPTYTTVWWVGNHPTVAEALSAARRSEPGRFETHVAYDRVSGRSATLWAGDAGYDDGDLFRPGPRRRLWMDRGRWQVEITPAPGGEKEYKAEGQAPA